MSEEAIGHSAIKHSRHHSAVQHLRVSLVHGVTMKGGRYAAIKTALKFQMEAVIIIAAADDASAVTRFRNRGVVIHYSVSAPSCFRYGSDHANDARRKDRFVRFTHRFSRSLGTQRHHLDELFVECAYSARRFSRAFGHHPFRRPCDEETRPGISAFFV